MTTSELHTKYFKCNIQIYFAKNTIEFVLPYVYFEPFDVLVVLHSVEERWQHMVSACYH